MLKLHSSNKLQNMFLLWAMQVGSCQRGNFEEMFLSFQKAYKSKEPNIMTGEIITVKFDGGGGELLQNVFGTHLKDMMQCSCEPLGSNSSSVDTGCLAQL